MGGGGVGFWRPKKVKGAGMEWVWGTQSHMVKGLRGSLGESSWGVFLEGRVKVITLGSVAEGERQVLPRQTKAARRGKRERNGTSRAHQKK